MEKKKKGCPLPYSVYYVQASNGGDVLIEVVEAPNATVARQNAKKRLPGSTILHIRKGIDPADQSDFPSARFIKGKFRLANFSDDSMLMEINK
ncbi:MAG: hypothetical protein OEY85_12210 [Rhodospirillales bacterium]|nr:hypothetical protein [Rhodospirillales bacterium]